MTSGDSLPLGEIVARQDPASPIGICLAFIAANPDNAEALRQRSCQVCHDSASRGDSAQERERLCDAHLCGLRNPALFADEQRWCANALASLWDTEQADPQKIAAVNNHIARARCVTPAIAAGDDGRLGIGFSSVTLRGGIHAALVAWLTFLAGEIRVNIFEMKASDFRTMIAQHRSARRRALMRGQHHRAEQLRLQGVSDYAIAKQLGVTHKSVRDWLGPREEWDRTHEHGT